MKPSQREALRELLRRVDEVRGLAERTGAPVAVEPDDTAALIRTVGELVEELERSHRRLIETNVQLVSLREVANRMVTALDSGETARTVSRYLARAFGFRHAFLLLVNRDTGCLEGTWTHGQEEHEHSVSLEVPLLGDRGGLARSLWLNRTVVLRDTERHPPVLLPEGHPLRELLGQVGSVACVPLQRSHSMLPATEPHELCGARCILGDAELLVPPPGRAADGWAVERDDRQRHCLACELMPTLGVIGMARSLDEPRLASGDVTLLESIALSVAPVVENARLYQELRKSERFRLHVLDSIPSALVAVNMKGEVLIFNRAAQQLLGFQESEVIGQPFGALVGSEAELLLQETLEHGRETPREETTLRGKDGSPVPVAFSTSLLRNERRNVYGAIATFVDLTPLKRAEDHARRQDRLAALGRFTSSVAHEIRNPLTGIGAGVQYLSRSIGEDDPQREHLNFILSEIRRLDRIVQDLFDITHPRGLQARVASLEDAVRRALQSLEAHLTERGIAVEIQAQPMTPAVAYDADQIQQVFINLIKNAAEASRPGGRIRISIAPSAARRRGGRAAHAPSVVARIHDEGTGISPEHLKTIFEPFFTTKPGGTGLGLYICHDIVKRHGGTLTVQSEVGRGTTFSLDLPLDMNGGQP
jgi:PAS domain S-box-containing protein